MNDDQLSSPHRDDTITLVLSQMYFPSADAGTSCGTEAYATIQQAHADPMAYIERRSAAHLLLLCFARPSSSLWSQHDIIEGLFLHLKEHLLGYFAILKSDLHQQRASCSDGPIQ